MGLFQKYMKWLHTQWPAGTVEKLPRVREDGSTNVPGLYIVGDLTGIPLLKFSCDTGAKAVQTIVDDPAFQSSRAAGAAGVRDLIIIGGGVSGMAAALEAKKRELDFDLLEASQPFSTIVNFPKRKPIYVYPTDMVPEGDLKVSAEVKEELLEELDQQIKAAGIEPVIARAESVQRRGDHFDVVVPKQDTIKARRVIVAIGRSGNFRKLGVPGEELDKVSNRLHDPKDFEGKDVLVVGGGDSALETAIAIAQCHGRVVLSYRKPEFSRPKPENIDAINQLAKDPRADVSVERPKSQLVSTATGRFIKDFLKDRNQAGSLTLMMGSQVKEITEDAVIIVDGEGRERRFNNDAVFPTIGREAPLDFFRRSGVEISGEMRKKDWALFSLFLLFTTLVYLWKGGTWVGDWFKETLNFPNVIPETLNRLLGGEAGLQASDALGTLAISLQKPGFYYSLVYCICIVAFGRTRIKRRKTPYVKLQTYTLMAIQLLPLFFLPYLLLPYLGHNGLFDDGLGKSVADALFPAVDYDPHGREYWRAFGFILAWPLFLWNVFTDQPMWTWLIISLVQTFVIIPGLVYFWGKGAYCGWICSCGALAETMGDEHREKMPHGPFWNRLNMVGQVILWIALLLFALRVISWIAPGSWVDGFYYGLSEGWHTPVIPTFGGWGLRSIYLNYKWVVDFALAGVVGIGFYFWFSGRVWCRFACPLAALMHIYARFSRFRILTDKKKCISCNVCTSVCHQGIDIMNFANKGMPMSDPECVRCSACVQSCPTGVLEFGQVDPGTGKELKRDRLMASPVIAKERSLPMHV